MVPKGEAQRNILGRALLIRHASIISLSRPLSSQPYNPSSNYFDPLLDIALAPLLFHALTIRSTTWSMPLPFFTWANIVGPPSLVEIRQPYPTAPHNSSEQAYLPDFPSIPVHDIQVGANDLRKICLVDNQQITLRDTWSSLAWDFVASTDIDHVDDVVC